MAQATVVSVTGNAVVVAADGSIRPLKAGDVIQRGEIIRTMDGARVELLMEDGQVVALAPGQELRVDESLAQTESTPTAAEAALVPGSIEQILQVLEEGGDLTEELEAAAAGAGGGGGGDGSDFVRLLRVVEGVDPLAYEFTTSVLDPIDNIPGAVAAPVVLNFTVGLEEESMPERGGNDEDDGFSHTQSGNFLTGVGGIISSISVPGFAPVAVASGGVTIYFDANGNALGADEPVETPWSVELTIFPNGSYTVTVVNPLNHTGEGEDLLTLDQVTLNGRAGNGGALTINLGLTVQDDVPEETDNSVSATVTENDILTDLSRGTSPNDGNRDGSFTGDPISPFDRGPANVTGSVASLVSFGADGRGSNGFGLSSDLSSLEAQWLKSKGDALSYRVEGNLLIAFVGVSKGAVPGLGQGDIPLFNDGLPVEGGEERIVFTLRVESNGNYAFRLYDQLDHDAPGEGENDQNLPINFASVIVATDGDGDSITLNGGFTINITDDTPRETGWLPSMGVVEEEALPVIGNQEMGDIWPDTAVVRGSVANQVRGGADDDITFSLSLEKANLPNLTSNGQEVSYVIDQEGVLVAHVGQIGEESYREVFTLELNEQGIWTFTLKSQLDHPPGRGENLLSLDLSSFIVATDFDQDPINLQDALVITVVDDTPVVSVGGPTWVSEDGEPVNGTWNASIGADQGGTLAVVYKGSTHAFGAPIAVVEDGQNLGTLAVAANGTWTFDPNPNLKNASGINFTFAVQVTDADSDTVSDRHTVRVKDGANPSEGGRVDLALDEEALGNANATGTDPASDADSRSAELTFQAGSDDLTSFAFASDLTSLLTNTDGVNGPELEWQRSSDGQTVTGVFAGTSNVAITLTLNAPASIGHGTTGTVTVAATLSDNLKHAIANGEQVLDLGSIRVVAADHDGDSTFGTVSLSIKDDVPTVNVTSALQLTLSITNFGETSAGYNNSFGYYIKDAEGKPTVGFVIWDNVKNFVNGSVTITGYTPDQIGFFIIPNGDSLNAGLASNTDVSFQFVNGEWQAFSGGAPLLGQGAHVLFDVATLNKDGLDHVKDNAKPGNLNWEDIHGGGDRDYDDINIGVVWSSNLPVLTTQDADTMGDAKDEAGASFAAMFSVTSNPGADGLGSQTLAYTLSVGNAVSGLSSDGKAITLFLIDGKVVGSTAATAGEVTAGNTVFDISVDADGNVKQTQYAELDHPGENADGDPFNNTASLVGLPASAVKLTATATLIDSDGDPATAAQTLDISASFRFEDDVPLARDDADTANAEGMATGNVITGEDTTSPAAGADRQSADSDTTVTAVNDTLLSFADDGWSQWIAGDSGSIRFRADGSYEYQADFAEPITTIATYGQQGNVMVKAYDLGESFLANGKFTEAGASASDVTSGGSGNAFFGVAGTSGPNTSVGSQINYSGSLSQALSFAFTAGPVLSATVSVSNLFQNENGGEAARWHAFDAEGNRIGTGVISRNTDSEPYASTTTVNWNGSNNAGSFTVSDIGAFTTLVIEGIPYSQNGFAANDDSDFFARVDAFTTLANEGQYRDSFTYTITDGDGDSATARLTITGEQPLPQGEPVNDDPVAVGNRYVVKGEEISGNVITDDDDGKGAASGRDWDQDTPVLNLSVVAIEFGGKVYVLEAGSNTFTLPKGTLTIETNGQFTYEPNEGAVGNQTFRYQLSDGQGGESGFALVTIKHAFTLPALDAEVEVGQGRLDTVVITNANATSTGQGFSVQAFNLDGSNGDISVRTESANSGFGVKQQASGADVEIGESNGQAQRLEVTFDAPVSSVELKLAWLRGGSNHETAVVQMFRAGALIESVEIKGLTDTIDDFGTISVTGGALFDKLVFSVPTSNPYAGDDYLVHSIEFVKSTTFPVDITVTPTDFDAASLREVVISVPTGASLSAGIDNLDGTWTLRPASDTGYTVGPAAGGGFSVSGLTMTVAGESAGVASPSVVVATVADADGNLLVSGNGGSNDLDGGSGNDILVGGAGNDVLSGGDGEDIFAFTLADTTTLGGGYTDIIEDFGPGDVLDIGDLLTVPGSDVLAVDDGSGTTLTFTNNAAVVVQTIVLEGYTDPMGVNNIIDSLKNNGNYNA